MSAVQFTLSKKALNELFEFASGDDGQIVKACEEFDQKFDSTPGERLTALSLRRYFAEYVGDLLAGRFVATLMGFVRSIEKLELSQSDFLSMLIGELKENPQWDESKIDKISKTFVLLAFNERIALIHKGSRLYFESDKSLSEFSIISEARPVFNKDASVVHGYIIRNVLRIESEDLDDTIELALSEQDLEQIEQQVLRAKTKLATLQKELSSNKNGNVAIFGAKFDGSR